MSLSMTTNLISSQLKEGHPIHLAGIEGGIEGSVTEMLESVFNVSKNENTLHKMKTQRRKIMPYGPT